MVINGNCSDRDVVLALEELNKKQMGVTHEIPKNPNSSLKSFRPSSGSSPEEIRNNLSQVVPRTT